MPEPDPLPAVLDALDFAADRHRDQRRKGIESSPYINHPIHVARLLVDIGGVRDNATVIAAILHDTIEDTRTTGQEIEARFGLRVRSLVEEVTDDTRLPRLERKRLQIEHASDLSDAAKQIKIADKISNVRDVVLAPPRDWSLQRRLDYLNWAAAVVDRCRGVNPGLDSCWDELAGRARSRIQSERPPGEEDGR